MDKLEELVYQALGQASMCWSERPKGVFDSEQACQIGETLMKAIRQHVNVVAHLSSAEIIRDAQGNEIARRK
jgi:hypothetical protein